MGLGKTLSVLALIAWYLDSLSRDSFSPRTTLVITTTSSKYLALLCVNFFNTLPAIPGWEQQISR